MRLHETAEGRMRLQSRSLVVSGWLLMRLRDCISVVSQSHREGLAAVSQSHSRRSRETAEIQKLLGAGRGAVKCSLAVLQS